MNNLSEPYRAGQRYHGNVLGGQSDSSGGTSHLRIPLNMSCSQKTLEHMDGCHSALLSEVQNLFKSLEHRTKHTTKEGQETGY